MAIFLRDKVPEEHNDTKFETSYSGSPTAPALTLKGSNVYNHITKYYYDPEGVEQCKPSDPSFTGTDRSVFEP